MGTGLIYVATHNASGKKYVGCTTKGLEMRKAQHLLSAAQGSPYKFHKALRELGFSAFSWRVICSCDGKADMYAKEKHWIAAYNSYRNGFNSTPGGAGTKADGLRHKARMPQQFPRKPYKPALIRR